MTPTSTNTSTLLPTAAPQSAGPAPMVIDARGASYDIVPPSNRQQAGNILPPTQAAFKPVASPGLPGLDFTQFANNPLGAATAFQNAQAQLSGQQQQARSDAYNQYAQMIQGYGSTADTYNQLANAQGVPVYQKTMNDLQYAISHLRDNVTQRTQGYNINSAQADQLYNQELTPLAQNLADVGREYNTATTNIGNLLKYYGDDRTLQLKPIEAYLQSLDQSFINQNQVLGNMGTLGLNSVQNASQNELEKQKFDQATMQFAQTFGLEQLKNSEAVDQFAKTYGLDQDRFRQSVAQFDKTFGLENERFNQSASQFAQTFGLEQLKNQQLVDQFAKTFGLDVEKFRQAQNEFSANNAYSINRDAQDRALELDKFREAQNEFKVGNALDVQKLALEQQKAAQLSNSGSDIAKYLAAVSTPSAAPSAPSLESLWNQPLSANAIARLRGGF